MYRIQIDRNRYCLHSHLDLYLGNLVKGQTKNLPLVLAGGGFKHGEHKVYPKEEIQRVPAANLLLSILQNSGLEVDQFGSSTGTLRGLEWKA